MTASTRWWPVICWLNSCQSCGRVPLATGCGHCGSRTPPQATLLPGQNIVAVRIPAFSAVTHRGSPPFHQKGSSFDIEKTSPARAASSMVFATTPW